MNHLTISNNSKDPLAIIKTHFQEAHFIAIMMTFLLHLRGFLECHLKDHKDNNKNNNNNNKRIFKISNSKEIDQQTKE